MMSNQIDNQTNDRINHLIEQVKQEYELPDELVMLLDTMKQIIPRIQTLQEEKKELRQILLARSGFDADTMFELPADLQRWLENNDTLSNLSIRTLREYYQILYTLTFVGSPVEYKDQTYIRLKHVTTAKGVTDESKLRELFNKYDQIGNVLIFFPEDDEMQVHSKLVGLAPQFLVSPPEEAVRAFQTRFDIELAYLDELEYLPSLLQIEVEKLKLRSNSRDTLIRYLMELFRLMTESESGYVRSTDLAEQLGIEDSRQISRLFTQHGFLERIVDYRDDIDSTRAFYFRIVDEYL